MKSILKFLLALGVVFSLFMPLAQAGGGNNSDGSKDPDGNSTDQERGHKGKKHGHAE